MPNSVTRRQVVKSTALAGAAIAAYHTSSALAQQESAAESITGA